MIWIKVDANLDDHPKAVDAGFWGLVAVQLIWRITKRHGRHGIVGPEYVTKRHLRHLSRCNAGEANKLAGGVESCLSAGFLKKLPDGSILCVNWPEHQEDPNHAERQAKYRKKAAEARNQETSRDESDAACPSRDAVTTTGQDGILPKDIPTREDLMAQERAKGATERWLDFIGRIAGVVESEFQRAHGMTSGASQEKLWTVAKYLCETAKADGYLTTKRAEDAVRGMLALYFADQDPFVAAAKHPIAMLTSDTVVNRYRRPLTKPAAPEVKPNA